MKKRVLTSMLITTATLGATVLGRMGYSDNS